MSTQLHLQIQIPSSALLTPAASTFEEHFIIRFPPGLAASVRSDLQETGLPGDLEISFTDREKRQARVKFDGRTYSAVLCDMPTILETHKTSDRQQYVKVADINQVLLVLEGTAEQIRQRQEDLRAADYRLSDGLTPPMQACRQRRFGSKIAEKAKRMEEIERRVKELLAADEKAMSSNYTLYDSRNRPVNLDRRKKKVTEQPTAMQSESEMGQQEDDIGQELDQELEQMDEEAAESGDSEFAAELEGGLLIDDEEQEETNMLGDTMDVNMGANAETSAVEPAEPTLPPELLNLKKQIEERRLQLSSVTNVAIRERIEDAIKYLEDQLASKLSALQR